jgi:caffeoyl-CoA O-methyltransferase
VIDNVLWGGSVIDEANQSAATQAIRAFNLKLQSDERVDLVMLPVADGVSLAVKR